jgi:high-affinity Fe2+/Pb2+ permease
MVDVVRDTRLDHGAGTTAGPDSASVADLVDGILKDMQQLTSQQLALFKQELADDFRKARQAAVCWAIALVGMLVGGILLALAVAQLIFWGTPLPLWVCYLIVGVAVLLISAGLGYAGLKRLESLNPIPEQSVRALKENVQCLTNPR